MKSDRRADGPGNAADAGPLTSEPRLDSMPVEEALKRLAADVGTGLASREVPARLARFGPNELPPPTKEGWPSRLLRHLRDPLTLLLIAAAAVSGLGLGERVDAVAILAIVILNVAIGLGQEGKAERALEALRTMETPTARVRRDDRVVSLPARELVPGDVVVVAAGDRVPADLRAVEASSLELDESLLTGESLPVRKDPQVTAPAHAPASERRAMLFAGSLVTRGTGMGVAVATGPRTELGLIAEHLKRPAPSTPLQVELAGAAARLGAIAVAVAAAVFVLILVRLGVSRAGVQESFLAAVALAVAAVPEGLATVVTVALALGVRRMAGEGAIIRRLPAVETLGATTVILTDKTGTLTENRLRMTDVVMANGEPQSATTLPVQAKAAVAEVATLCNDATLDPPLGDPLEVALLEAFGARFHDDLRRTRPRIAEVPFDSERKRMSTLHRRGSVVILLAKGAPESILERSDEALSPDGASAPLGETARSELLRVADSMARRGMRTLALARRRLGQVPDHPEDEEKHLTFVALVGLQDPVRPEARAAVAEAHSAGVRVLMVTGDHAGTAAAVAREMGLTAPGEEVTTGATLRQSGLDLDRGGTSVYARVDPDQKLALVEAFRSRGDVVAVTGDGVNDAPALRQAHIGIAMGRSGSDVAREAADMVITDDNLSTIVTAVREGRGIYDNIRKVVDYLIAGNLSEITVVVASLLLFPALGVPLLPLQLLWINLLTDGPPALALGVDPPDPSLMTRAPRRADERLLEARRLAVLFARGGLIAAASIGSLAVARYAWGEPWGHARAVMFSVLMTGHLLYAFVARRPNRGVFSNPWLLLGVAGGILLQLMIVLWPAARPLFGTAHLTLREWVLVAAAGTLPVVAMVALPFTSEAATRFSRSSDHR